MMNTMPVSENLLEVRDHKKEGYLPVVDYGNWRVAILNHSDALRAENISAMQRHNETDEVFVLLRGRCILFLGEGLETVTALHASDMQPYKIYNVKKGVWHTHTLSRDAMVLIVENRDTTFGNSPFTSLNEPQRQTIAALTQRLWREMGGTEVPPVAHGG